MQTQWCWRCRQTVPMLDDTEHATLIAAMLREQQQHDSPADEGPADDEAATVLESGENRFSAVIDVFERLTGSRDCTTHAIQYHRVSLYGSPCPRCGKPLRTAKATECYECAHRAASGET